MQRAYSVRLLEGLDGSIVVYVVNTSMAGWAESGFTGTRQGNPVRFNVTDNVSEDYVLIEQIPGVGNLRYSGTATGTIDNNKIVATFNGWFRLDQGWGSEECSCQAPDHKMEFTASGS